MTKEKKYNLELMEIYKLIIARNNNNNSWFKEIIIVQK